MSKIRGIIYGAALGDAAGWPFEFEDKRDIEEKLSYVPLETAVRVYTDDTQMTIACANGILEGDLYASYQNWALTQNDGNQRRAPGLTVMASLRNAVKGRVDYRINTSKGNGGIMRISPHGYSSIFATDAFADAATDAALTHSHIMGFIPAGIQSYLINTLIENRYSVSEAIDILREHQDAYLGKLGVFSNKDRELVKDYIEDLYILTQFPDALPEKDAIQSRVNQYGRGTADTTLWVALYALLNYGSNFEKGVRFCITTSDDSDTFAAVYGALYGAMYGDEHLPSSWIERLEEKEALDAVIEAFETRYSWFWRTP